MRKIGVSTGTIFPILMENSINKEIEILKNFDINTIELLFYYKKGLDEEIKDMDFIKKMDYVSIHAPYEEGLFYKNKEDIKKVEEIYNKISAKAVVFHPNIVDFDLFKDSKMNICFENMSPRRHFSFNEFKILFEKYPNFKLILDTSHALNHNKEELERLIDNFKDKIQHVHLSDCGHSNIKDFTNFQKLKELNCPIILETAEENQTIDKIKIEIEACSRNLFI